MPWLYRDVELAVSQKDPNIQEALPMMFMESLRPDTEANCSETEISLSTSGK